MRKRRSCTGATSAALPRRQVKPPVGCAAPTLCRSCPALPCPPSLVPRSCHTWLRSSCCQLATENCRDTATLPRLLEGDCCAWSRSELSTTAREQRCLSCRPSVPPRARSHGEAQQRGQVWGLGRFSGATPKNPIHPHRALFRGARSPRSSPGDFYGREVLGRPGLCFVLSPAPRLLPAR